MFLQVTLCYLSWFQLVALSRPDAPQFVCSPEHYCLAHASQPLPLAMPLDFESVSGKQDHFDVRQLEVLPSMTPIWYSFSSAAFLLLVPRPPDEPYLQDSLLSSSAPTVAHSRSYVHSHISVLHHKQQDPQNLFSTITLQQGGSLLLRPIFPSKLSWKPLPFYLPTVNVNPTLSRDINKNELSSSEFLLHPVHFSFHTRSAQVTFLPPCFATMSLFSSGSPSKTGRQPKASSAKASPRGTRNSSGRRQPATTFVPASPRSQLVFTDTAVAPIFSTKAEMFQLSMQATLRHSLFDRNDPLPQVEILHRSLLIQGLPWSGSPDKERAVMSSIYDRLYEGGIELEPQQFTNAQTQYYKAFLNRTSENGATTGMLGSGRKTITLLYNLKEPAASRESTYLNPHVLPPYLAFELTALKEQKENRTVDITTYFTVTPQPMAVDSTMWLDTINSAGRLAPTWRSVFFLTWIHADLDFISGAMRLDIDQFLRQSLPVQDYEYFTQNSIVVPSRPHLDHCEGLYNKCGGAGLSYWLYSDPQNMAATALRRRLLTLLFGEPKNTVAFGLLHGVNTVLFQTQGVQNRLVMSDHPFPTDLHILEHWLVPFDNLPFELNTHMFFVLLVHGFGFPVTSILNICHDYDVLNQNHISAAERATPRTIVMFSAPEPVLLCLHYKRQLTKSIETLFPAECVPDFLPPRDDTYTIAISSPNLGTGPLPPLPSSARIGECPTLCISRTELLALCQDSTVVPLRPTPTVPLGTPASAQPTTPTRDGAITSSTSAGLSQHSALDTMSSWRSPLAEVTAPPRASSHASDARKTTSWTRSPSVLLCKRPLLPLRFSTLPCQVRPPWKNALQSSRARRSLNLALQQTSLGGLIR